MGRRPVLILTGEPSGDRAGGRLAEALREIEPSLPIRAVGGQHLAAAGADIVQDVAELGAMGFAEVLRQIPRLKRLEDRLERILREDPPSVVVPIDYPGFNLRIARRARAHGIPVVYYIGPQVWAWGAGRVPRIGEVVNRMVVVFPFEEEIYSDAGIPVDFVGHPLVDELVRSPSREEARDELGLPGEGRVLGLLPGSRVQEVRRILPVMCEAARLVRRELGELSVIASRAGDVPFDEYDRALDDPGVMLVNGPAARVMRAADALLVTSGTATLEAALHGTPLAVLYRTSPVTWFIGSRLVRIPRISLVNIVAEDELVPEFLQGEAKPEPIARHVIGLFRDDRRRGEVADRLRSLRERLGDGGASRRAAEIVLAEARG